MLTLKTKLGDLLISKGLVTAAEFDSCLDESKHTGIRVGEVLIQKGYLTEDQVYRAISEQQGLDFIDLNDSGIDTKIASKVNISILTKYSALPIDEDDVHVIFTFKDPLDLTAQDAVQRLFPKKMLKIVGSNPSLVEKYLKQYEINESIKDITNDIKKEIAHDTSINSDASAVYKLIQVIVQTAVYSRASDIHIEPTEKSCIVRARIDGILKEIFSFEQEIYPPLGSRIKLMGHLDIAEKRKPQDGRFSLNVNKKDYDFRLSTLPTTHGESLVLRILDETKVLINLEDLGMRKENFRRFNASLKSAHGIILLTGPTGSGKTTTLYAALNAIKGVDKKIITVEDPVEYSVGMVQQVQVNEKAGLHFSTVLRSILRQDPDIIMIGEIRDKETLKIAVQSALTGHLVLSTLHTNDALGAITRMVDMGIEPYLVAPSLIAVEGQRLVRKLCPHCKEAYMPSASAISTIEQYLPESPIFFKPIGCEKCSNTGYLGREMISEVLTINDELSAAITKGATKQELEAIAKADGFESLFQDGINRVATGITSLEEVYRVSRL